MYFLLQLIWFLLVFFTFALDQVKENASSNRNRAQSEGLEPQKNLQIAASDSTCVSADCDKGGGVLV
jgi:hypothetical protein